MSRKNISLKAIPYRSVIFTMLVGYWPRLVVCQLDP